MSKKICIDAGHYGKINVSPTIPEYYESERMWELHLLLKKQLEMYGFEVIQTRAKQDVNLGVELRGLAAKGCDLFLSLHSNAVASYTMDENVDYPLAFVPLNGSADELGKLLSEVVAKVMETEQNGRVATRRFDEDENRELDYYGVIRGAVSVGVPAILLEHSFHTNSRIVRWLLDDKNLERLAAAEARVIAEYFGVGDEPEDYPEWKARIVGAEELNVRETPNGEVIGVIYSVTVIGEAPDSDGDIWYKVRIGDGREGYVWPKYISI